jgi:hypothetical protein
MARHFGLSNPPDVSPEQRASNELIQLIRKLRWMGMEDEVKQAQKALTLCPSGPADSGIAGPRDTD